MSQGIAALVLAAGKGTRMRSRRAKVLHELLGWPMVCYPVRAAVEAGIDQVVLVVGHQGDEVAAAVRAHMPDASVTTAIQEQQLGTGDAVRAGLPKTEDSEHVLILSGDTPALDGETLRALIEAHVGAGAALTVTTFEVADPTGYGRVLRGEDGHPTRIVEHKDASEAQREVREVNAGLYLVRREALARALERVGADNAQGEVYLTDVLHILVGDGEPCRGFRLADPSVVAGVNTRAQLALLEGTLRARRNAELMESGVTMDRPETVRVDQAARVGRDTSLGAGVELRGRTVVGEGCRIDAGSVLSGCTLADDVHVKPYVVADGAVFGTGAAAGPFAHLRPGTVLGQDVKIGNFVETKKANVGRGSKASHLTYLGDCEIGEGVNIGAGTITCNYDGIQKHRTVLEDGVFVGSDTQFIAPVKVGKNATVAAGTTVVADVPEGALVHSRARQQVRENYYELYRLPREQKKAKAKAEAEKE